eukprot:442911-Ditylum_brightwellii.AAC.1
MHLYETVEHPEHVDIIGSSDNIQDRMKRLPFGTYCAVITSVTGKCCLEYPSDQDLKELQHVDFCSTGEWKPDEENNNNEDKI